MKSKDFLKKFCRITTYTISPFVVLLLLTPITHISVIVNLCCIVIGVLFSLVISQWLQNDFVIIRFKDKILFLSELSYNLHKIGYTQIDTETPNKIVYRGTIQTSLLLAGDIEVKVLTKKALITAPKIYLNKLIKLFLQTNMYLLYPSLDNMKKKHKLLLNLSSKNPQKKCREL